MASQILPGYPALAQHSYIVTLGELRYRFTFTWRERPKSWYFDLQAQDGTELVLGRRLAPGWSPLLSVDLGDYTLDGLLYCRGPSNYERSDWGDTLRLVFVPQADIDAATVEVNDGLTYTVAP